jgi:hypothetical protein
VYIYFSLRRVKGRKKLTFFETECQRRYLGQRGRIQQEDGESCRERGGFLICAPQPNYVRFIKYNRVIWTGLVAHMRKKRSLYGDLVVKPE